jgi:hypothetical protein
LIVVTALALAAMAYVGRYFDSPRPELAPGGAMARAHQDVDGFSARPPYKIGHARAASRADRLP